VLTNITVQQVTPFVDPGGTTHIRNLLLTIPWLHAYHGHSSWADQCDTMNIELSKNVKIFYTDSKGVQVSLASANTSLGNYTDDNTLINGVPTFMQGDMITLNVGYTTKLMGNGESAVTYITGGNDPTGIYASGTPIPPLFRGFIAKVTPTYVRKSGKKNTDSMFSLQCEDAMWLLKQISTGAPMQWLDYNIPEIVDQLLQSDEADSVLNNYKDSTGAPYFNISIAQYSQSNLVFNLADIWTQGESIGSFLAKARSEYSIYSYFRGYELRIGLITYIPGDAVTQSFTFLQNILDGDKLEFKRKDDNVMSIDVMATYATPKEGATTKDSVQVMTKASTEVLVYVNNDGDYDFVPKTPGSDFPASETGTKHNYSFYGTTTTSDSIIDITDPQQLFNVGLMMLKKQYYNGLQGTFTTFGVPYVKHGDVIQLTHPLLPEMNGMYLCRAVEYYGGAEEGLRQTITLDFKINSYADIAAYS